MIGLGLGTGRGYWKLTSEAMATLVISFGVEGVGTAGVLSTDT